MSTDEMYVDNTVLIEA